MKRLVDSDVVKKGVQRAKLRQDMGSTIVAGGLMGAVAIGIFTNMVVGCAIALAGIAIGNWVTYS